MRYEKRQIFEHGVSVDAESGSLCTKAGYAVNAIPVRIAAGSRIKPLDKTLKYRCFYYKPEIADKLIYTYAYQPDANWTTFIPEKTEDILSAGSRSVAEECFIRITVRENDIDTDSTFDDVFCIENGESQRNIPGWMTAEAESVCARAEAVRRDGDAVFLLLTDPHYSTGCIWDDTVLSMKIVSSKLVPDGIICLGDLTDGMLSLRHTKGITEDILKDLRQVCSSLYLCLGNHDLNYFRGNPDRMTRQMGARLILGEDQLWYFRDIPDRKLRMIFLDSFDPERKERYGFDDHEIVWLRKVLRKTPRGYKILVFSHITPLPENHVWSIDILNSSRAMRALENFNKKKKNSVIGWIYGHNHADQMIGYRDFPLISIGCSKLEAFNEHKPEDAVTYTREKGTRTQELWDILMVHNEGSMDLIRFGAGKDRCTSKGDIYNDQSE